jgi:hypothetical protein
MVVVVADFNRYLFSLPILQKTSVLIPEYEWIKNGKDWIRVEKPVNKWKGIPPIEDEIKKPLD